MPSVELLQQVLDAFNRHDLDAIMAAFSEDAILESPRGAEPWGTRYVGKAAVREGLASRFAGIPDVHYSDDRHWVCGNRGVSEWLLTGTTTAGERLRSLGIPRRSDRAQRLLLEDRNSLTATTLVI